MPMRYDFCLLLCRPISPVGLNTGSVRPIGCANTGFVSRFCLRQYALLCRPISPVGLNTGSVRPIGCANTGFVSPYLARWAQYGLLLILTTRQIQAFNRSALPLRSAHSLFLRCNSTKRLCPYRSALPLRSAHSLFMR